MWRILAKLRQLKKKSRQRRRPQTLLQPRLRLHNHRPQMFLRLNRGRRHRQLPLRQRNLYRRNHRRRMQAPLTRERVVLRRLHRRLLLRRRPVLLQLHPPLLRVHHRVLRLHRIQLAYRRLIPRPGIIDIFIHRAARARTTGIRPCRLTNFFTRNIRSVASARPTHCNSRAETRRRRAGKLFQPTRPNVSLLI